MPEDLFRPQLGEPHHYAYVVEDIQATVDRLVDQRVERGFSAPRPGIHHVAHAVAPAEVAELRGSLDKRGLPQYLSAQLGEIDVTFHDASATLGHDLEIHVDSQGLRDSFGMVSDAAEGWDGSQPLRPIEN